MVITRSTRKPVEKVTGRGVAHPRRTGSLAAMASNFRWFASPNMTIDKQRSDDSRGVSPVIGVILMVAITVILAAVIATFVLDLGSGVQEDATAGIDIDPNETGMDVTWISEGNSVGIDIQEGDCSKSAPGTDHDLDAVGQTAAINCAGHNDTVSVVAVTAEGVETVVGTETIEDG